MYLDHDTSASLCVIAQLVAIALQAADGITTMRVVAAGGVEMNHRVWSVFQHLGFKQGLWVTKVTSAALQAVIWVVPGALVDDVPWWLAVVAVGLGAGALVKGGVMPVLNNLAVRRKQRRAS